MPLKFYTRPPGPPTDARFGRDGTLNGMELDWSREPLADGLRAYRNGEYFLAHEYWEQCWLGCVQPEKTFVQALIQLACGMHHFCRGNRRGASSLLDRSLLKLQNYPAEFAGVAVDALRREITSWILALASPTPPAVWPAPPVPEIREQRELTWDAPSPGLP